MGYDTNTVLLATAFFEGAAALILLVIYGLLTPSLPSRFFRYWVIGWSFFFVVQIAKVVLRVRGLSGDNSAVYPLAVAAGAFFLAAAFEFTGLTKRLKYLLYGGVVVCAGLIALDLAKQYMILHWGKSLVESVLYLAAGWLLWRSQSRHRGFGLQLLACALLLCGLHGLDRPIWIGQHLFVFRVALQGVFTLTAGIAMAVLTLEADRTRNDNLNERLRRLALITAEATQSLRVDKALDGILRHLVETLNASHGIVFLIDNESPGAPSLEIGASVGFSEKYRAQYERVSPRAHWPREVFLSPSKFISGSVAEDACLRDCLRPEELAAAIVLIVPGKEAPLGLLAIASKTPRKFSRDEAEFLLNVANLLGLTLQNIALFESAAVSRTQWRDTFDSIDDLIFVHSNDGRILRTNRAFAARVHLEPVAVIGRHVRDVLRRGSAQWDCCPYCEGVAGKAEESDPTFDGYFLATNSTLHGTEDDRLGAIHVLKDFTSRRLAENKFRNLFEKAQEGVFVVAPDGRLLDCNDALTRLHGFDDRAELLRVYRPENFYVDMADRARFTAKIEELGEVRGFEFLFRRRDGEIRTAQLSAFVTRDDSGSSVAYQGFLLDVTERNRAEKEIRRRNQELLALNTIGDILRQSATLDDGLTEALRKVTELFAVDAGALYRFDERENVLRLSASLGCESASGDSSCIHNAGVLIESIRETHATLLSGTEPGLPENFRRLQAQEGLAGLQISVLWAKDRVMGALLLGCRQPREFSPADLNLLAAIGNQFATTIDKSLLLEETREAYESLRQTQEQLLQSEKMAAVGQLVAGVAHELNNPLTAVLGYSQLLQSQEFTNSRGTDYLAKLYKQAQRTHHIVQSLLSFARQHRPERTLVDLNQILDDTLILRGYDMKSANIRVHRQFDPRLPGTGADFHQLQQVFLNILNNAVDAVGEISVAGEIWIRTERLADRLCVEFTNNGPPIQNPQRVFDPFYTTKPVGKGTGLGLSICYGIIKEHGGEIDVRNSPRGVTFTIRLPLVAATQRALIPENTSASPANAIGNVLVLDAEEAVLQLEQEILQARGLCVRSARSAWEAMDLLKKEMFDAAVLDARIPGDTSAFDLYRWIEQHRPELAARVIFTTSSIRDSQLAGLQEKVGCPLLIKPFAVQDFWKSIQKVLAAETPASLRR